MDVVKVSAKTVEDALTEASIELGTSSDNIEYTVIDEGSKGFFGFGSRKAVIEARRKVSEEDLLKEIFEDKPKKPDKPKKEYKENKKESKKEYRQEEKQEKKEEKETKKEQKKDSQISADAKKEYKKDSRKDGRRDARPSNSRESVKKDAQTDQSAEDTRTSAESSQSRDLTKKESGSRKESSRKESGREHSREYTRKDSAAADHMTSDAEAVAAKNQKFARKDSAVSGNDASDSEVVATKNRESTRMDSAVSGKEASDQKAGAGTGIGIAVNETQQTVQNDFTAGGDSDISAVDDAASVVPKTPVDPEEAKSRAIAFVKDVLSAMNLNDEVTARFEEDTLCVNIEGENMGILIGKRGQTLDSLQYLTSLVVNKGKSSYVRVKVDTEDYRNRRKATLENLAKNIAFKVKKTGKPVFLEPMNPYERRIIHAALQNDPYVTTHSEGEEPYRKVVVTLKKEREKDRDRERNDRGDRRRSYSRYGNGRRGRGNRQDYERDGRSRRGSYMQDYEDAQSLTNEDAGINVQTGESEE